MTTDAPQKAINIDSLTVNELNQFYTNLKREFDVIQASVDHLSIYLSKLNMSKNTCLSCKDFGDTDEMILPVSKMLYVKGTPNFKENKKTLVADIGTGYYAEMTFDQAAAFLERQISFVNKQLEQFSPVLANKEMQLNAVYKSLLKKGAEQQAQMKQKK